MWQPVSFFSLAILLAACNGVKTGEGLRPSEKQYIQSLGLLDSGETILLFSSQLNLKGSGNLLTDKRLAAYWVDERDAAKDERAFAYFPDIRALDTNYMRNSLTFAPYLEVTRADGTKFKVHVSGSEHEVRQFFEAAFNRWKAAQPNLINRRTGKLQPQPHDHS